MRLAELALRRNDGGDQSRLGRARLRVAMLPQLERSGVSIAVDAERIKAALERDPPFNATPTQLKLPPPQKASACAPFSLIVSCCLLGWPSPPWPRPT